MLKISQDHHTAQPNWSARHLCDTGILLRFRELRTTAQIWNCSLSTMETSSKRRPVEQKELRHREKKKVGRKKVGQWQDPAPFVTRYAKPNLLREISRTRIRKQSSSLRMEVKKSFKGEVAWPEIHTKVEAVLPLELINAMKFQDRSCQSSSDHPNNHVAVLGLVGIHENTRNIVWIEENHSFETTTKRQKLPHGTPAPAVLLEQKTHPLSHRKFTTCLPLVKQTLGGGLRAPM